jgi:hypothetical protein
MTTEERLQQLEASHIRLMTQHEVFVLEQEAAWKRHQQFVAEQEQSWKQYQIWRQEEKQRGIEIDARIAKMISGIGEFIRVSTK